MDNTKGALTINGYSSASLADATDEIQREVKDLVVYDNYDTDFQSGQIKVQHGSFDVGKVTP